jgi:uncharacterized protein YraI
VQHTQFTRFIRLIVGLIMIAASAGHAGVLPALTGPGADVARAELLQTTNQLVVIAFSDTTGAGPFVCPGCDIIFSSSDQEADAQNPLPPMEFVVSNQRTGEQLGRRQAERQPQGRYQAVFDLPADLQDSITLMLATEPAGFDLCPTLSSSRTIAVSDFVLGTHQEVYAFWTGCPLQVVPSATPAQARATPAPASPTPAPPSPTLQPTATPSTVGLPERTIVVEAFVDVAGPGGLDCPGCDQIFSSTDQSANTADPLPDLTFRLTEADTGRLLGRQTTHLDIQGRARTSFRLPAGFGAAVIVALDSSAGNYQLCPNSAPRRRIASGDFVLNTRLEQFPFWRSCALTTPAPAPASLVTATPTRPAATARPVPPTGTATPVPATATATPVTPTATATRTAPPTPTPHTPTVTPSPLIPTATTTRTPLPGGMLSAVVTAGALNVRTGPGIEFRRLGVVSNSTRLVLSGRDADGLWVRGRAPDEDLEGWLSAAYIRSAADLMALPVLAPGGELQPTAAPTSAGTLSAVVTSFALNVRSGPGTGFGITDAVGNATRLLLDGRNGEGTWVHGRVVGDDLEGWLSAAYLRMTGELQALPVLGPGGEEQPTPTPAPTFTPTPMVIPEKLPSTGTLDIPLWGLLVFGAATLLAFSHMWRWWLEAREA